MNTQEKLTKVDLLAGLAVTVTIIMGGLWLFYGAIIGAWLASVATITLVGLGGTVALLLITGAGYTLFLGGHGLLSLVERAHGVFIAFQLQRETVNMAQANTKYRMAEVDKVGADSRLIDSQAMANGIKVLPLSITKGCVVVHNGETRIIPPLPQPSQQPMLTNGGADTGGVVGHDVWFPVACNKLHVILLGESGSGKSVTAKAMATVARQVGRVVAIDPHAMPNEWDGLEVVGAGRDYQAIDGFFSGAVKEMANRYKLRTKGQATFQRLTIIIDETTSIAQHCNNWEQFFSDIATEGRKVEIRLIILIHGKGVKVLKLEGRGDLRHNLSFIRLGEHAIDEMKEAGAMDRPAMMRLNGVNRLIDTSKLTELMASETHSPNVSVTKTGELTELMTSEGEPLEGGHVTPQHPTTSEILATLANDKERVIAGLLLSGMHDEAIAKHIAGKYDDNLPKISKVRSKLNGYLTVA